MQTDRQEDDLGAPEPRVGDRRLAAIMFTDIVGYTGLTQSNEALALELLEEHRQLLRQISAAHGGEEIQTIGDSFLIEFRNALDAVKCAIDMQQALSRRNLESTSIRQIQVRIGIHVGDVVRIGKDVYGDTVNLAKRIESLSEPSGIAISAQACEQVRNKIPISIEKMEEHRLKNVSMPMLIYKIRATRNGKPTSVSPDRHSRFAVLPFLNIGLEDEYLADGLTEELISAFSHLPGIKVVARTTMMRYRNSQKSILEIGNELNVSTILEGSVRKYGNQLRVTVQ